MQILLAGHSRGLDVWLVFMGLLLLDWCGCMIAR